MKFPFHNSVLRFPALQLVVIAAISYISGGLSYHYFRITEQHIAQRAMHAKSNNSANSLAESTDMHRWWGGDKSLIINKQSILHTQLKNNKTVCFIGDSITAGSENGGYPWYGPLVDAYPHIQVNSMAAGGGTSKSMLQLSQTKLMPSDLYIIALGTNDIRYRDAQKAAITVTDYIENLNMLVSKARELSSTAQFIFIAPWCSIPEDPVPPISQSEKEKLMKIYSDALQQFCRSKNHLYLNPNPILNFLIKHPQLRAHYMKDHIHPTFPHGCYLYSAAVMEAASASPCWTGS